MSDPIYSFISVQWGLSSYLGRDTFLRASASTGQAIVLGYVIAVAIGFYLFIQDVIPSSLNKKICALILFAGLIAPLSRGPWLGAGVLIIIFILTGQNAIKRLLTLFVVSLIALSVTASIPGGEKIINLLSFIGQTEKQNIDYREKLIDNSMIVINRNPMFGSTVYLDTPEMQEMRQGAGTMIDVVNTYIGIALETGLIGLCLFAGFFFVIIKYIRTGMKVENNKSSEYYLLGRALLCTLVAILFTIITVSSISFIPIIYWSVAALGVAYYQMMKLKKEAK